MANTSTQTANEAFYFITAVSALLFFAIIFVMLYFLVRYRRSRNPVPTEIHGNALLEISGVVVSTFIALSMFAYGLTGFSFLTTSKEGALEVAVHSRQWSFLFEYGNGVKSPDLVLPSGREMKLTLSSDDVIHAFYVPAYRVQMDAVPGMKTYVNFKTGAVGSFDILCAQYCGTLHSSMLAKMHVLPPADFETWLSGGKVSLAGAVLPSIVATGTELLRRGGCLNCHSTDGSARPGPSFKAMFGSTVRVRSGGATKSLVLDREALTKAILEPGAEIAVGFQNIMPPGSGVFDQAELLEAVKAIEELK